MFLAIICEGFAKAKKLVDDLEEEQNIMADVWDVLKYSVRRRWRHWPSRAMLKKMLSEQIADNGKKKQCHLALGHFEEEFEKYGFRTSDEVINWFEWQKRN